MSTDPNAPETTTERKPYASPKLEAHGSVEQLTHQIKKDAVGGSPAGDSPVPSSDADFN